MFGQWRNLLQAQSYGNEGLVLPTLQDWELALNADDVLRAQGGDPAAIRARSPRLVEIAEHALEEGRPLLRPQATYRELEVATLRHERLTLVSGGSLTGALIAQHLATASRIVVLLCTVGDMLETHASKAMASDALRGLALDGLGSAAVEALASIVCHHVESVARNDNLQTSVPLSPGMIGWPVGEGQAQVFALLDAGEIGVKLTEAGMMVPRKSLSMVLGIGSNMRLAGRTCDYCSMRETCRYQDHYG